MKGEYVKQENDNNNNKIFPKFPHQPPPQIFPPPHLHPPFPDSATPPPPSKKPKPTPLSSNEDGGTIVTPRRPRGRPPGSKNKPKPPIFITREPEPGPVMSPYILELQSGADIVDTLTRFTRRRGVSLCVLTATGAVTDVTLNQPSSSTPAGTVTFHGRFDILSLSALVIVPPAPFLHGGGGFTISVAGPQGQIIGGKVVGSLVCSGIVYVTATSFCNPNYCRLPLDEEGKPPPRVSEGNDCSNDGEENSPVEGGGDGGGGGTVALYGGHLGGGTCSVASDEVIWATPTSSRPPY